MIRDVIDEAECKLWEDLI
jgi:hypothetical protein